MKVAVPPGRRTAIPAHSTTIRKSEPASRSETKVRDALLSGTRMNCIPNVSRENQPRKELTDVRKEAQPHTPDYTFHDSVNGVVHTQRH